MRRLIVARSRARACAKARRPFERPLARFCKHCASNCSRSVESVTSRLALRARITALICSNQQHARRESSTQAHQQKLVALVRATSGKLSKVSFGEFVYVAQARICRCLHLAETGGPLRATGGDVRDNRINITCVSCGYIYILNWRVTACVRASADTNALSSGVRFQLPSAATTTTTTASTGAHAARKPCARRKLAADQLGALDLVSRIVLLHARVCPTVSSRLVGARARHESAAVAGCIAAPTTRDAAQIEREK